MNLSFFRAVLVTALSVFSTCSGSEIPAGQVLEARLITSCGTQISKSGDAVFAVLISPVVHEGSIVVAAGTKIEGTIVDVARMGFGIKNGRARLGFRFHTIHQENGTTLPLNARLVQVDTAREKVDGLGRIYGISPSITVSGALSSYAWRLVLLEPTVGSAVWTTKLLFAPAPDPEILYPRGTEILLQVASPTWIAEPDHASLVSALQEEDALNWISLLNGLPSMRIQEKSGREGDRINFALKAHPDSILQAFRASGWEIADQRNIGSVTQTYFAIVRRRGYDTAPMSPMKYMDGAPSFELQKSLNTFSRRHHLRLWRAGEASDGTPLWVGSATEDINIGFSKKSRRWTHTIDEDIDNERTKILSDLIFTECVTTASLVTGRPVMVPNISTDGMIAVAHLGLCNEPRQMPLNTLNKPRPMNRFLRGLSALGKDMVRSNFVTLGLTTGRIPPHTFMDKGKFSSFRPRSAWAQQQRSLFLPPNPLISNPEPEQE